jgi:hypothetical protein
LFRYFPVFFIISSSPGDGVCVDATVLVHQAVTIADLQYFTLFSPRTPDPSGRSPKKHDKPLKREAV